jgi:hypothetical protein
MLNRLTEANIEKKPTKLNPQEYQTLMTGNVRRSDGYK